MVAKALSDDEFIRIWRESGGSPQRMAEAAGVNLRGIYKRRNTIEKERGITLAATDDRTGRAATEDQLPKQGMRRIASVTGNVVVFSDAHFWPGAESVAYKALIELLPVLKPTMVVANGDILDGARISRHDRIGWEQRPRLTDELDACREKMDTIRQKSRGAKHVWNLGNHCIRLARYLAMHAPEMEDVMGSELTDHIKHWELGWSLFLNEQVMVKHRFKGGIHAAWNNVIQAGVTMVTGHTHALEARPFTDYRGLRWGIQTGTLLDLGPECGPTAYREDDPLVAGRSGFVVLHFDAGGKMRPPSLVEVMDGHAYFDRERVV